ncbi:hypothetical protein [Roseovarius phycicola]|uniref:Ada DNA repair metal-binding domain-containing protein n=1 Tax=Roseovarius phycicola TaxID=3080976 RepID=A0ABZ2HD79_9RHOB
MTLQNRVQPTGDILAVPDRGTLMGNRGILHDDHQRLTARRWQHPHWVTCITTYKDWHRKVMQPHNYTELFFLDEPTALAAGHRPCGLCRHKDYTRFKTLFNAANGTQTLDQIDRLMQRDRITRSRIQVRYKAQAADLPDGTFVLHDATPHLLWETHALRYSPAGYTNALPRPTGAITVLTPASTVATLQQGYQPAPHQTAYDFF